MTGQSPVRPGCLECSLHRGPTSGGRSSGLALGPWWTGWARSHLLQPLKAAGLVVSGTGCGPPSWQMLSHVSSLSCYQCDIISDVTNRTGMPWVGKTSLEGGTLPSSWLQAIFAALLSRPLHASRLSPPPPRVCPFLHVIRNGE